MPKIPSLLLRQLYTFGSLKNHDGGFQFSLKNRLSDATLTGILGLKVNGRDVSLDGVTVDVGEGSPVAVKTFSAEYPLPFPLRQVAHVAAQREPLEKGMHEIQLTLEVAPFGRLDLTVKDAVAGVEAAPAARLPYAKDAANYSPEIIAQRRRFVEAYSGARLAHVSQYGFDPACTKGNIENFTGVAQVPLGIAGPLLVHGEHADGEYLIPLATTEGTLVASYNRGMKVLNLSGGVRCTIAADMMQRAPVFIFESAREARDFRDWVGAHLDDLRREAEGTDRFLTMLDIDVYLANKFAYLRFNFATGDAAGQNMVGRATFAACSWILDHHPPIRRFYLESNLATDKKASHVNLLRTRGKRVTAEAVIQRSHLQQVMRVDPESIHYHNQVANVGAFLSGANNNGLHSPNAITAMFIATGQDVANVSEGSAGIIYSEVTPAGDLYLSITIPSLIVATYGGGTGLPTQRECLELMGCYGKGNVGKLAEIVAGVVLAGELSLAAAISSLEWVSAHERYGRNG